MIRPIVCCGNHAPPYEYYAALNGTPMACATDVFNTILARAMLSASVRRAASDPASPRERTGDLRPVSQICEQEEKGMSKLKYSPCSLRRLQRLGDHRLLGAPQNPRTLRGNREAALFSLNRP